MTTHVRSRQFLLTAGLVITLAACGSGAGSSSPRANGSVTGAVPTQGASSTSAGTTSPTPAAPAGTADACALVTKSEVEAAFGETMTAPIPTTVRGNSECSWAHQTGGLDLTVSINAKPSTASAIKAMEAAYAGTGVDVPGVGDAAFEVAGILEFVKGTTLVTIGTGDGPAIISVEKFHALAAIAAGRI